MSLGRIISHYLSSSEYIIYLLEKHENYNNYDFIVQQLDRIHLSKRRKCLFILDVEEFLSDGIKSLIKEKICFGKNFSNHVEAAIFIWEYFR